MKTERNNSAHGSGSMRQHEPREGQHETEASVTAWLASVSPRLMDLRPLSLVALFGEIVELLGWGSLDDMGHCGWAQPSSGLSSQLPTVTSPIYAPAAPYILAFPLMICFPGARRRPSKVFCPSKEKTNLYSLQCLPPVTASCQPGPVS